MPQTNRPIDLSVSKISKEVPGNYLATAGSACILELLLPSTEEPDLQATACQTEIRKQTFLVTTNQVVTESDLLSSAACKADFLPVSWWSTKTFGLNNVPIKDVPISDQSDDDISLVLIPTEPLHKQRTLSRWRRNEFQLDRPQIVHRCKATEVREVNDGQLYCYVMRENAPEKPFRLQCYLIKRDKDGTFFLRASGNQSRLRTLKDFDSTESPMGSPIRDKNGVVGFLAFGRNYEIRPLFFPQNREGEGHVKETEESASGERGSAEGRSSDDDGHGSQTQSNRSTDTEAESDPKKIHEDNQLVHMLLQQVKDKQDDSDDSQIRAENQSDKEDSYEDTDLNKNATVTDNRSQPSELSYVSTTGRGSDSYQEGRKSSSDCLTGGQPGSVPPPRPPLPRSQSERPSTPRIERMPLLKSFSEGGRSPIKSGDYVAKVIFVNVHVMDTLRRCLDTPFNRDVQYWLQWAHRQGVPEENITALKFGSLESRSEVLFQVVQTVDPNLSVATLIDHLLELDMNDVVKCITDLDLNGNENFNEVLDSGDVPGRFFTLLDKKREEKWNQLGKKLGLDGQKLNWIKIYCANRKQNPAENIIAIICAAKPTMTIGQFKKHLENIQRNDVREKLNLSPAKTYSTISDIQKDLNLKRELTSMLNDSGKINTYKELAEECGIDAEIYTNVQPAIPESPTVQVMEDILGRKPYYTVDELFTDLREMDRTDVVEAISRHFEEEDMRVLKRKLQISDE